MENVIVKIHHYLLINVEKQYISFQPIINELLEKRNDIAHGDPKIFQKEFLTQSKIKEISDALSRLDDSWKGDSADGFNLTMSEVLETIVNKHEEMGNLETSLQFVVETMESH